jgi:PKD repeat protein
MAVAASERLGRLSFGGRRGPFQEIADGFESGDMLAWSDSVPCPGCPIADFFAFASPGLQVHFQNQSTGDQPLSYLWEFGDGNLRSEISPTHTYANEGTYTVRLTATNPVGTASVVKLVTMTN